MNQIIFNSKILTSVITLIFISVLSNLLNKNIVTKETKNKISINKNKINDRITYIDYQNENKNILFQIKILKYALTQNITLYKEYKKIFSKNINYVPSIKNVINGKVNTANTSIEKEISILYNMQDIVKIHPYNYLKLFRINNYSVPKISIYNSKKNQFYLKKIETYSYKINKSYLDMNNISYQSEEDLVGIHSMASFFSFSKSFIFSKIHNSWNNILFFSTYLDNLANCNRLENEKTAENSSLIKNNNFINKNNKYIKNHSGKKNSYNSNIKHISGKSYIIAIPFICVGLIAALIMGKNSPWVISKIYSGKRRGKKFRSKKPVEKYFELSRIDNLHRVKKDSNNIIGNKKVQNTHSIFSQNYDEHSGNILDVASVLPVNNYSGDFLQANSNHKELFPSLFDSSITFNVLDDSQADNYIFDKSQTIETNLQPTISKSSTHDYLPGEDNHIDFVDIQENESDLVPCQEYNSITWNNEEDSWLIKHKLSTRLLVEPPELRQQEHTIVQINNPCLLPLQKSLESEEESKYILSWLHLSDGVQFTFWYDLYKERKIAVGMKRIQFDAILKNFVFQKLFVYFEKRDMPNITEVYSNIRAVIRNRKDEFGCHDHDLGHFDDLDKFFSLAIQHKRDPGSKITSNGWFVEPCFYYGKKSDFISVSQTQREYLKTQKNKFEDMKTWLPETWKADVYNNKLLVECMANSKHISEKDLCSLRMRSIRNEICFDLKQAMDVHISRLNMPDRKYSEYKVSDKCFSDLARKLAECKLVRGTKIDHTGIKEEHLLEKIKQLYRETHIL